MLRGLPSWVASNLVDQPDTGYLNDTSLLFVTMLPQLQLTPPDAVFLPSQEWNELLPRLRYGLIERESASSALSRGRMTVTDSAEQPRVWIAWRWVEMAAGVVVQEDQLAVSSNARILDPRGIPLTSKSQFVALQTVMYRLTWWKHVNLDSFKQGVGTVQHVLLPAPE